MKLRMVFSKNKFAPFFWTQFLGAFNDNLLKNALIVLVTFRGIQLMGLDAASLVALASGLFILPFFLFSPLAGQLADKYEKSEIVRKVKFLEIVIMVFAAVGFLTENYIMLLVVLFFMGLQSTFFGPVKYSLIPNLVTEDQLTEGNAFIELGTFLAILFGTLLGGIVSAHPRVDIIASACLLVFAGLGYWTSRGVQPSTIAAPELKINYNPFPEFVSLWRLIRKKIAIYNSILAISWFWFFGAGILSVLPIYVREHLHGSEEVVTLFLGAFTIGIGVGSVLCEKFSYKRVEVGLVPIGSLGMTLFLGDLCWVGAPWEEWVPGTLPLGMFLNSFAGWRLLFDFLMMSIFGGLFIVPLYTLLQDRSEEESRSRVIAANNIVNAIFMVISSVLIVVLYKLNFSTVEVFGIYSILNFFAAVYIYCVVPEFTLRFYSWILSRIVYSVKVTGLEFIPKNDPFVLAGNHVSYVDWLIVAGACKRPVRLVMYYKFFKIPVAKWIMSQAKVIPIAGAKEDPQIMNKAFDTISQELSAGEALCIFPEGQLTYDGKLSPFRPGLSKILERNPVVVVPFVLHGLWGSIFSRKVPREAPRRRSLTVEFLAPIEAEKATPEVLESKIASALGEVPPHRRVSKG